MGYEVKLRCKLSPLITFSLAFSLLLLLSSNSVLAWYSGYTDWQYRKEITITEQSGNTLTNYQVKLTIDTASLISQGKMNSDCSDIRFTWYNESSGEEVEIPYWIESGCNSANTIIWVKVPFIPANSQTTIYMYYGNPSAGSESNGDNVFEYFNDFFSCNGWNFKGESSYVCNGGIAHYTSSNSYPTTFYMNYNLDRNTPVGWRIVFRTKYSISGAGINVGPSVFSNFGGLGSYYIQDGYRVERNTETGMWLYKISSGSDTTLASTSYANANYNSWADREIRITQEKVYAVDDGVTILSADTTYASFTKVGLYDRTSTSATHNSEYYVDWVLIGKYTDPEPTYSIGAEELTNQPPQITITNPTNTTYYTTSLNLKFKVTDDNSTTFWVKAWIEDNLIYENTSYQNNSEITLNLQSYITQDRSYFVKIWTNDTNSQNPKTSEEEVYFTISTIPYFTNFTVSPPSPQTYGVSEIWFNVSVGDELSNQLSVLLETDLTKTPTNYTLLNDTPTHFYYHWQIQPSAGTYSYKFYVNDTAGNWNVSDIYTYTINKGVSNLKLSSSQGWSIYVGTETTISATSTVQPPHLKINGVEVSNPYTFLPQVGFYDVYAYIDDYENYTDWNASATLTVLSLPTCVRNTTLAFERNITVTNDIMLLNFTKLVQEHYVKEDLSDVYILSNASNIWRNSTTLIVNATGLSTLTVRFGNYYTNIHYPTHSLLPGDEVDMSANYTQVNPYALVNLRDELTATALYPPGAELYGIVGCSLGESIFTIENGTTSFLIASVDPITEISVRVKYSADAYYRRTRLFDNLTTIYTDLYVADAYEVALDRVDLVMADPDYYDAKCQIYRESAGHDIIVTEGYFDASHKLSVYLVEDTTYNIRVIDSDGNVVEYGDLVVVEPETKVIGGATLNLQPTSQLIANHLLINAYLYEGENITHIDYVDDLGKTNNITIYIFNSTNHLIYHHTYPSTSELHINVSTPSPSNEVVFDIYHSTFGHVQSSIFVGRQETVETGAKQSYMDLISLFILLGIAGLISVRSLVGGAIVFDGLLILLKAIGWLSLSITSIAFLVILSVIAVIIHLMRTGD